LSLIKEVREYTKMRLERLSGTELNFIIDFMGHP
jgi:hypothetical protein